MATALSAAKGDCMVASSKACACDDCQLELPFDPPLPPCSPEPEPCRDLMLAEPAPQPPLRPDLSAQLLLYKNLS